MRMDINKRVLLWSALAVAFVCAAAGLLLRVAAEKANKSVAFVAEYREVASLAYQNNVEPADVWRRINDLGVLGVAAAEYTGD